LDGLRGLAILMVLSFHAFSRWPDLVPYGDQYSYVFQGGWLGVQLFFLISGFVILMSLEKCSSIGVFLYKRWIRLFPAMLVCSLLIFITSIFLSERPIGKPELTNLIPGLTFIEPYWWSKLLGIEVTGLEDAFWSLYVEFKFYVAASILYFSVGRAKLVFSLLSLYLFSISLKVAVIYSDNGILHIINEISNTLSLHQFGWFAAGSAFYIFHDTRNKNWFYFAIFISLICSTTVQDNISIPSIIGAIFVSSIFSLSFISTKIQHILKSRVLCFFGLISYPLYLIHENAMISMIIQMSNWSPTLPGYLYPIAPITLLIGTAYLIIKYAEPYVKIKLVNILSRPFLNASRSKT
jgi:peptidoglycan/LPS O-acetylase OafA/YrhL